MKPQKDIYNHARQLESIQTKLNQAAISIRNQELIREFDRACFMESLSKPRRIKLIGTLIILARDYFRKDFDQASKDDLQKVVMAIDSRDDYSPWTKHSYKTIIKKFYKWLKFGDEYRSKLEYPKIVAWLRCSLKKKHRPKINSCDILTESEVKRLIDAAEHPRDKAFICMLYELGARIGEIGGLHLKEVSKDKHSYLVDLEGKTGHRTPRIVISDPHLTHWLNAHPLKDRRDAPLWCMIGARNKGNKMKYGTFRALVLRLVRKAGIKKRVYPHLFRHTRVTHLLLNKQINEAQAKVYFGWVPSSTMLSEYSHLVSSDVNDAILAMHGIKTGEEKESLLKPQQCPRCACINEKEALFCHKCASVLDVKTAITLDEKRKSSDDLMSELVKDPKIKEILVQKILELGIKDKLLKD
jgi:integrase